MRQIKQLGILLSCSSLLLAGCNGDVKRDRPEVQPEPVKNSWQKTAIITVTNGGLLSTNVKAVPDQLDENRIHFVYLVDAHEPTEADPEPPIEYSLRHLVWNKSTAESGAVESTTDIVTLDNTLEFDLAIDQNNTLYASYRGGNEAHCNTKQSDTMVAVKYNETDTWTEYLGATGYSGSRNPAYTDGDAGDYSSMAIDSNGNIHLAFQFFWEGCDSNNKLHPDVLYIQKSAAAMDSYDVNDEEQVEGNDYANTNYQNAVGFYNSLILDVDDNPVVFYGAREVNYNEHGLRIARRINGNWQSEWIDRGCYIGDVSAALSPTGELAVAYNIDECTQHISYTEDDGHALRYAVYTEDGWQIHTVDEATKVGTYTALAFDSLGMPAIVYYETESYGIGNQRDLYNLKMATLDLETNKWFRQRVDEAANVGMYNSIWFDANDNLFVTSFSKTDNTIYLYTETRE